MKTLQKFMPSLWLGFGERTGPSRFRMWHPRQWGGIATTLLLVLAASAVAAGLATVAAVVMLRPEGAAEAARTLGQRLGVIAAEPARGVDTSDTKQAATVSGGIGDDAAPNEPSQPEQPVLESPPPAAPGDLIVEPLARGERPKPVPSPDRPAEAPKAPEVVKQADPPLLPEPETSPDRQRERTAELLSRYERIQRGLALSGEPNEAIDDAVRELRARLKELDGATRGVQR